MVLVVETILESNCGVFQGPFIGVLEMLRMYNLLLILFQIWLMMYITCKTMDMLVL